MFYLKIEVFFADVVDCRIKDNIFYKAFKTQSSKIFTNANDIEI